MGTAVLFVPRGAGQDETQGNRSDTGAAPGCAFCFTCPPNPLVPTAGGFTGKYMCGYYELENISTGRLCPAPASPRWRSNSLSAGGFSGRPVSLCRRQQLMGA